MDPSVENKLVILNGYQNRRLTPSLVESVYNVDALTSLFSNLFESSFLSEPRIT
jgi:hypothetical protein